MEKSKKEPNKSTNDSELTEDANVANSENKGAGRRLQDATILKDSNRKLNLERRIPGIDRRTDTDPRYKGPARRYTIDPRENLKDRRDKD